MSHAATAQAASSSKSQSDVQTLLLSQKAELVSHFAGAIAHEFNNIMMAVSGYAEVEMKKAPPAQKRGLERLLTDTTRVASLIQKLLALSGPHEPSPQLLSLNSIITEADDLLQVLLGERVEIALKLHPQIQAVKADPREMEQLLLSLAVSTRRPAGRGGKLAISTGVTELDRTSLEPGEEAKPGTYVTVSVSAAEGRTAEPTDGQAPRDSTDLEPTGQALPAAYALVNKAGGLIRTLGSARKHRSYKVFLPAHGRTASEERVSGTIVKNSPLANTILVVEDDDAVRVPAAEFLKMEGFKVLQAKTGPEALQIVERHQGSLDMLVTDILMPEMGGREVAEELRRVHPSLKVLYMSGNSENISAFKGMENLTQAVLQKPFRLNRLNEKIRDLLRQ